MTDGFDPTNPNSNENSQTPPPVEPFGVPLTPPPPSPYSQTPPQAPSAPSAPGIGEYYSNQQGYSASGAKNDPFSIVSLVTSLVGIPFVCCWPLGVVLCIIGIVFGAISLNKIGKSNGTVGGKGMAIAGLSVGIVVLVLIIALVVIGAVSDEVTFS